MDFSLQLIALLVTMGVYKPWERVAQLLCYRWFRREIPKEVCVACAITLFMCIAATITVLTK